MDNITFGKYIPINSTIHQLDPRLKILTLLNGFISLKKQEYAPVWHAAPICSTKINSVSKSQSKYIPLIFWKWPDVSPLCHSSFLLLEKKQVWFVSNILWYASSLT